MVRPLAGYIAKMVDIHQKYDFLLHPIKDLMKNWQIDIAGVLEDYLDEVLWKYVFLMRYCGSMFLDEVLWEHHHSLD